MQLTEVFTRLMEESQDYGVWYHGTASQDLRGGRTGLHLGTYKAATMALEAQIGVPAEGEWDGTREYGKTKLMGKKRIPQTGRYVSGFNCHAPDEDYYPAQHPGIDKLKFVDGTPMNMAMKPTILKMKIVGRMSNSPWRPHGDWQANGRMAGMIRRGVARSGYYYENISEDAGSISIVVPNGDWVKVIGVGK